MTAHHVTNPQPLDTFKLNEHVYVSMYVANPVVAVYMGRIWDIRQEDNGDWEIEVWTNPDATASAEMQFRSYCFDIYGFPKACYDHPAFFLATSRELRE